MSQALSRRALLAWTALTALAAACGSAATTSSAAPNATAVRTAGATAVATASTTAANAWTLTDKSKATVSVREQLVGVNLPSDAVLTATGASGGFLLKDDGTFSAESKISIDLTTLASDARNRDDFVKMDTLQVRQFPRAEFTPTKISGITLPLPATGDLTFTLTGNMTIHGKTKEVTFDVKAKRSGGDLTATAAANPTWRFADFGMTAPSVPFRVVSVTDEIRLVVDIVATGPKG